MTRIQLRRATAASWTSVNPILALGEVGIETDTYRLKVGNGTTQWSGLPYFDQSWANITGKPAVIASGATQADARTSIGLGSVDNTSDANKPVSTATQTALNGKENSITAGTTSQYWRGDKTFQTLDKSAVGLGNVDNTSDATKNSAAVTLTNKTVSNPTITNYTESVVAIGTVSSSHTLSLTNGTVQTATLTASTACAFTMPTATAGKSFVLMLKQAASTGNGTATFTGVKWSSAGTPTMTPTAGRMDIFTFFSDGTNWYGSAAQGFTP